MFFFSFLVTGHNFHGKNVFLSLKIAFVMTNSVDPDEMQQYAAFHLGLHCLPKFPLKSFQYTDGQKYIYGHVRPCSVTLDFMLLFFFKPNYDSILGVD